MERTPQVPIRRKDLLTAGITQSHLTNLCNRNTYFKSRARSWGFFTPSDALFALISEELLKVIPLPDMSLVLDEFIKNHPQILYTLDRDPEQFLVLEVKPVELLGELFPEERGRFKEYSEPYLTTPENLKAWDWAKYRSVLLINLKDLHARVRDLVDQAKSQLKPME